MSGCCCNRTEEKTPCSCQNVNNFLWIKSYKKIDNEEKTVPVVSTELKFQDIIGTLKVRCGIGRTNYSIEPGLYAIGNPDQNSVVLVTANYKLTFDTLRKDLDGLDLWLVVLDTKGVNVWCAAGKGTFGTKELCDKIKICSLEKIVNHRTLILPQLGASGVSSHEVKKNTGFNIIYGPVRSQDIKLFLANNMKKTDSMRQVYFTLKDRLVVAPIEVLLSLHYILGIAALLFLLGILDYRGVTEQVFIEQVKYIGTLITAYFIFPALLPWIPSRSFALKGAIIGAIFILLVNIGQFSSHIFFIDMFLFIPLVALIALNFTGCTTYTNMSGVKWEVKVSMPIIVFFIILGVILKICFIVRIF